MAFSALSGHLSAVRCTRFAYGPADATATTSSLASLKYIMVFTFLGLAYPGYPGKEPLNGCLSFIFLLFRSGKYIMVITVLFLTEYFVEEVTAHTGTVIWVDKTGASLFDLLKHIKLTTSARNCYKLRLGIERVQACTR